jgi:hypothetical protein
LVARELEPVAVNVLEGLCGGYGVGKPITSADWGPWVQIWGAKSGFAAADNRWQSLYPTTTTFPSALAKRAT